MRKEHETLKIDPLSLVWCSSQSSRGHLTNATLNSVLIRSELIYYKSGYSKTNFGEAMNVPLELSNAEKYLPISFSAHSLLISSVLASGGNIHTLSSPTLFISPFLVGNTVSHRAIISENMIKWLRISTR